MALASWMVWIMGIYVLIGLFFAPFFVVRGVGTMDAVARNATAMFRVIIVPGVMVLWPYLALRWIRGASDPPEEKNAHRTAARVPRP
jgi:hypothetical protein